MTFTPCEDLQVVENFLKDIFLALNILLRIPEFNFKHPVTDVVLVEYSSSIQKQQCKHNRFKEQFSLELWGIPVQSNSRR